MPRGTNKGKWTAGCDLNSWPFNGMPVNFDLRLAGKFLGTLGADGMGKNRLGMAGEISFHLLPITPVVADALARGADGQQTSEGSDLVQRGGEPFNQLLALELRLFLLGDVAGDRRNPGNFAGSILDR